MHEQSDLRSENHILAGLPPEDYRRLAPHFETLEATRGEVLYRSEQHIDHCYFPLNSMVSLVSRTADGESVEVSVVGYEGFTGVSVLLGVDNSPYENMVQIPDGAVRVKAGVLREEFARGGAFQALALRYVQSLLLQTAQVAACNRLHSLSERLARWLLMSEDRCRCADLPLTQEFLSLMLGVRRPGVTETAVVLQARGLIDYTRGHIKIRDRAGLEEHACDCYRIIKEEFDRVTG
ncbi:MAG TPA: Crp/Fnr family transcriptional regulator [Pyrinomonadaceae bacterium]|jgi:CRP-like cAMP-binding protein